MQTRRHPLHDAIDAGRWDAEPLLGRLVVVAHAAFLHAGLVPCCGGGRSSASRRPLPDEIGAVASSLSLRYTIPEFLRQGRATAAGGETAVLRLCGHGRNLVVFYGYLTGDGNRPTTHWACIDAPFVAPILSGGLDGTARALANDALGVRLWYALAGWLGRRLFADMCWKNSALPPPRFMSLPADLPEAILCRLAGKDLAMVECTCTEMRDFVASGKLWIIKYMASRWPRRFSDIVSSSWLRHFLEPYSAKWCHLRRHLRRQRFLGKLHLLLLDVRCRRQDPTKHLTERAIMPRSTVPASGGGGGKRPVTAERRRRGKGVVHASSSRHRWMHR